MVTDNGTDPPVRAHKGALALLNSPLRRLLPGMCALSFVGRTSGRSITLPVQYGQEGRRLIVYVGRSQRKRWWRNFLGVRDVQVRIAGADRRGTGRVVDAGHPERHGADEIYRRRYPRAKISSDNPLVVIDLSTDDGASRPT